MVNFVLKKFQTEFYKMCQIAVVSEATCIEIQQQQPEILGEHSVKFHHLKPNNNNNNINKAVLLQRRVKKSKGCKFLNFFEFVM